MKPVRGTLRALAAVAVAVPVLLNGQTPDAAAVLAEARKALGGEKVQSLIIEGRSVRAATGTNGLATTSERPFELRIQVPDRMMRREMLAAMGNMSIYQHRGFNGADGLINQTDQPPQLAGGGVVFATRRIGGGPVEAQTPEQKEAQRRSQLLAIKKEYARIALGLFAAAPAVYPLEFTYAGEAQAPDGTAHVIDVKAEGDFAARLFIDQKTHRPLMLSWMDKEVLSTGGQIQTLSAGGVSREEMEKRAREREAAMKEAEAKRRTVEWRMYYSDYKAVAGVTLPHRFQTSADGKTIDETTYERVRLNQKIDEDLFKVTK